MRQLLYVWARPRCSPGKGILEMGPGGGGAEDSARVDGLAGEEGYASQRKWMKETGYGRRRRVEGVFSSARRIQGEALWSRKVRYLRQEIRLRVATHNMVTMLGVHA